MKGQPGPALSTRLVSKVETMAVLDRLRFACRRLACIPATSLAVSLPDGHPPATCSPGWSPRLFWPGRLGSHGASRRAEGLEGIQKSAEPTLLGRWADEAREGRHPA